GFFCYVGMNSLFIYLFTETGGAHWLTRIVQPFTVGVFGWMGDLTAAIATSLGVWGLMWYLFYLLANRKIFLRIFKASLQWGSGFDHFSLFPKPDCPVAKAACLHSTQSGHVIQLRAPCRRPR